MLKTKSAFALSELGVVAEHQLFLRRSVLLILAATVSSCSTSEMPFKTMIPPSMAEATQQGSTDAPDQSSEENTESAQTSLETGSEPESMAPAITLPEIGPGESNTDIESTDNSTAPIASEASCTTEVWALRQRSLQLINEARSVARSCGTEYFAAAQALRWNVALETASSKHSRDMATHNFFNHTGSDSSSVAIRLTSAGYIWGAVGENIAAGRKTAAATIEDWLESPGHCANIMSPNFTEVAVSCVEDNNTDYGTYWTNVLAAPR